MPPSLAERQARNKMRSQIALFSANAAARNKRRDGLHAKRREDAEIARCEKAEADKARRPNEASKGVSDMWKRMRGEKLCQAAGNGNILELQKLIEKEGGC